MEEYQKIPDSKYEINKLGSIRRVYKNGNIHQLNPWINNCGYRMVILDNRQKCLVHRLLAFTFIYNDDPYNKTIVDHIDRNRLNNDLSNLRWVSFIENNNNIQQGGGSICLCKDKVKYKGVIYYYTSYRVFYREIGVGNKRHSKRFKTEEEAKKYLNSLTKDIFDYNKEEKSCH